MSWNPPAPPALRRAVVVDDYDTSHRVAIENIVSYEYADGTWFLELTDRTVVALRLSYFPHLRLEPQT